VQKNDHGSPEIQCFACLEQQDTTTQDAQKGQTSYPPNPGGYFTQPPCVCRDSIFAQGRALSRAKPQLRG